MSDNNDWLNLAHEIMKPTNEESMAQKMERHKLIRMNNLSEALKAFLKDHIEVPADHQIMIDSVEIGPEGIVTVKYELFERSESPCDHYFNS